VRALAEARRFDEDVRSGAEWLELGLVHGIERDTELVLVEIQKETALIGIRDRVGKRSVAAQRIAARGFDLEDGGAEVGEQLAAEGAGNTLSDLDDTQIPERAQTITCPPSTSIT
jgi:hypothetical protein